MIHTYKKTKSNYQSLCQIGRGNAPFRFLVIGGGHKDLYGDGFFEVGNHESANYGAGLDWTRDAFWSELTQYLLDNNMFFEVIIFDEGSFSWITNNQEKVFENILNIFERHVSENGVMIITAYNARRTPPAVARFYELMRGTDMFVYANPGEFILSDGGSGDVFRIFQRQTATTMPFTDHTSIYQVDLDNNFVTEKHNKVLAYDSKKKAVDEKTIIEFIKTRFKNTKTCPVCTFENDLKQYLCEMCGTLLKEQVKKEQVKKEQVRLPTVPGVNKCIKCTFENKASNTICDVCEGSLLRIRESAPEPLPAPVPATNQTSGHGHAVCVDLSDPTNPRVMVCLLYVVKHPDHVRRISDIENSDLKTIGDLFRSLGEIKGMPDINPDATLSTVTPSDSMFINQNMRLIRYSGGDDIMEAKVLLERMINGDLSERLKGIIISETKKTLDQKHVPSNEAFRHQPPYNAIRWANCRWVHTVLIADVSKITDHVSIMFNYWLSGQREFGFLGDVKYPLVGMFDNMGCMKQLPPDNRDPTQNVIFGQLTAVEQHVHLEGIDYALGADMARIQISSC